MQVRIAKPGAGRGLGRSLSPKLHEARAVERATGRTMEVNPRLAPRLFVGSPRAMSLIGTELPSEDIRASVGDQRQTGLIADTVESTRMTIAESNLAPVDLIKRSRTFRGSVQGSAPVPQIGRPCGYA